MNGFTWYHFDLMLQDVPRMEGVYLKNMICHTFRNWPSTISTETRCPEIALVVRAVKVLSSVTMNTGHTNNLSVKYFPNFNERVVFELLCGCILNNFEFNQGKKKVKMLGKCGVLLRGSKGESWTAFYLLC